MGLSLGPYSRSGFRGREYSVRVLFGEFNVRPVRGVRRVVRHQTVFS